MIGRFPKVEADMCKYCGSGTETELCSLAHDHADMADLAREVGAALDAHDLARAHELMSRLLDLFDHHVAEEEGGLFRQLAGAGEADEEINWLESEHRTIRRELSVAVLEGLRGVRVPLSELCRHADIEDTDLFLFAQQVLGDKQWANLGGHPHTGPRPRT
jgi:hemerythrin-like domain-containing protein